MVELEADFETRLERNKTEHRLAHKPSKKDLIQSEKYLKDAEVRSRNNSIEGEIVNKNYIRINNTEIPASEVAQTIKEKFNL